MRAYFELLRPANVVTALADVLAGYAVAGALVGPGTAGLSALPALLLASGCLYGGGVVLNDFFDRELDAIERPERPIPSGRVPAEAVATLGFALLVAGMIAATRATFAAGVLGNAIALAVVAYDAVVKRHPVVGPLCMASCRALNFLLGVAAIPAALADRSVLAALPFVYIFSITVLSRGEVHGGRRRVAAWCVAGVAGVVAALAGLSVLQGLGGGFPAAEASLGPYPDGPWLGLLLTAALAYRVLPAFWRAYRDPGPMTIRGAVMAGVLSLVLLDAALAAIYAGIVYGLTVLALSVVAYGLSRLFAVT